MAEAEATEGTEEGAKAAAKGPGKGMLIGVLVGAAALGGGLGAFVVAPKLVPPAAAATRPAADAAHGEEGEAAAEGEDAPEGAAAAAEGEGGHGGEGAKEGEKGAGGKLFKLENIIVNPAGSQGTRFLMASVAIAVTAEQEEKLREKEVELRDAVVGVIAAQSLDALVAAGGRDTLKARIADAIAPVMGLKKKKPKVFIPQFVIQ